MALLTEGKALLTEGDPTTPLVGQSASGLSGHTHRCSVALTLLDRTISPLESLTNFMRYEEFRPAEPLERFIKCFWMLESAAAHSAAPERILPDGCTEIVFHLADPFDQHNSDGTTERQPLALWLARCGGIC